MIKEAKIATSFNTASGKHCCNILVNGVVVGKFDCPLVSIPQAVSTVATLKDLNMLLVVTNVSIPQAVSTVATYKHWVDTHKNMVSVSIPQAVSTVATCRS